MPHCSQSSFRCCLRPKGVTRATDTADKPGVILASLVGTTIEFYDFYVYATAAVLVFPVLVGLYLTGAALLTLVALILGKETQDIDIEALLLGYFPA